MTKTIIYILSIISLTNCSSEKVAINKVDRKVSTIIIEANKNSFEKFMSNPCDTFSIEFSGLYPIIDSIPNAFQDTLFLDNFLKDIGFVVVSSGYGNWENGPRIMTLELTKGDCKCTVFKKYYYNDSLADGKYKLRVTEKIVCNASNDALD